MHAMAPHFDHAARHFTSKYSHSGEKYDQQRLYGVYVQGTGDASGK